VDGNSNEFPPKKMVLKEAHGKGVASLHAHPSLWAF